MADTIQLKRGEGVPSSLKTGEPAFDLLNKELYIGDENEVPVNINSKNRTDIIVVGPKSLEDQGIDCTYYIQDMSNPNETTTIINQALQDAEKSIMKKVILVSENDGGTIYYIKGDITIPKGVSVEGRINNQGERPMISRSISSSNISLLSHSELKNIQIMSINLNLLVGNNLISCCSIGASDIVINSFSNILEFNNVLYSGQILISDNMGGNSIINNYIQTNIVLSANSSESIIVNNRINGKIIDNGINNLVNNNLFYNIEEE